MNLKPVQIRKSVNSIKIRTPPLCVHFSNVTEMEHLWLKSHVNFFIGFFLFNKVSNCVGKKNPTVSLLWGHFFFSPILNGKSKSGLFFLFLNGLVYKKDRQTLHVNKNKQSCLRGIPPSFYMHSPACYQI